MLTKIVLLYRWAIAYGVDAIRLDLKDTFAFIGNGSYVQVLSIAKFVSPYIVGEYQARFIIDLLVQDSLFII